MVTKKLLKELAKKHGTPLFVMDHEELRRNYATFKKHLPRVQAYFAVKALSDPAVVKTLFDAGASFDVASMPEFRIVHEYIKDMPDKQRQDWIWDKIIYANPIKPVETLRDPLRRSTGDDCGSLRSRGDLPADGGRDGGGAVSSGRRRGRPQDSDRHEDQ